jgi:hypothetical protein
MSDMHLMIVEYFKQQKGTSHGLQLMNKNSATTQRNVFSFLKKVFLTFL